MENKQGENHGWLNKLANGIIKRRVDSSLYSYMKIKIKDKMREKERKEARSINVRRKECILYRGTITNFYADCLLEISKGILKHIPLYLRFPQTTFCWSPTVHENRWGSTLTSRLYWMRNIMGSKCSLEEFILKKKGGDATYSLFLGESRACTIDSSTDVCCCTPVVLFMTTADWLTAKNVYNDRIKVKVKR